MDCAEIQEYLSEYIDGTLDASAETAVKTHISVCENCNSELTALKAVVEELGALEPVKAPDDFLEKIHARMAPRFGFDRIIRWLFIPFRVKIPLELAAAATLALLVVLVLNIQYPGKQIKQIPTASKSVRIAEKPTDEIQSVFKKEAETPSPTLEDIPATPSQGQHILRGGKSRVKTPVQPSFQQEFKPSIAVSGAAKAERPVIKNKPIELALIIKPEVAGGVYEPDMAMKAAQIQRNDKIVVGSERTQSDSYEKNALARRKVPAVDLTSRLKNIIQQYQGQIRHKEFDPQTEQLKSLDVEIFSKNYSSFCKELARLAMFQNPPPPLSDTHPAKIQVLIRIIHHER